MRVSKLGAMLGSREAAAVEQRMRDYRKIFGATGNKSLDAKRVSLCALTQRSKGSRG